MKKLPLLLALFFCSSLLSAQNYSEPRNSIKFGVGTVYLTPANFLDNNTLHLQYEHTLFRPIRIAVDGFKINGDIVENDGNEKSILAHQADAILNIALFSNSNNALKIGGGATWQKSTYRFTSAIERDSNDQIINKVFEEEKSEEFGWTAGLEYEVYVIRNFVLGTRLTYKQYNNGDKNYFFGINAGFRF